MSKRLYLFVNICILSICTRFFSMTKIYKYSRFDSLTGRRCLDGDIVFETKNIVSVTECVKVCSGQASCTGISHRQSTQECMGCNENIHVNNVSAAFEDSLFYRLDECPSNNGRIQLEINFRLQIYKAEKTQSEAELDCRNDLNGHLVILDEEWKINAVENVLMVCAGYHLKDFWVDGTRQSLLTEWKFADNRTIPMTQTTFWHEGDPDSQHLDRTCLRLRYRGNAGIYRLDDRKCSVENYYICEF